MKQLLSYIKLYLNGLLQSYSQILFSNNIYLGLILLIVSFFDLGAGISGVIGIVVVQLTATLFGYNKELIRNGIYSYNALLTCLALGFFYTLNIYVLILIIVAALLSFIFTLWFLTIFEKYRLPILSIPFLLVVWIVLLGAGNFSSFILNQKEYASLYQWLPQLFDESTYIIGESGFANLAYLYFRSLGAIFFQYNDLSGILIAIALLCVSRISFVSSIIGFIFGYLFYRYFEGDFSQLIYSYIGFNFILTAIALNGFFLVSNKKSILLLIIITPLIGLMISALYVFFGVFSLPIYSLPFCLIVILIVSALAYRTEYKGVFPVLYQSYSAEKNHYEFYNNSERFKAISFIDISLPFIGNWFISQGHDGGITHLEEWKNAWDFDVRDEGKKTYQGNGTSLKDYYCYNLPVIAPASGWIVALNTDVADNSIGKINTIQNWGNTIVIKHAEYLYSALSHLKGDTINLKIGDYVNKGDIIAHCGSSGRSPEPHLHFQLQATPNIGSPTIKYPISNFVIKENSIAKVYFYDIPKEGEYVSQVERHKFLTQAFTLTPGKKITWNYTEKNIDKKLSWEVFIDAYNQSYVYCKKTKAIAYFNNNGTVFYFTKFIGKKNSLLYYFFLANQKVLLGLYPEILINESVLTQGNFPKLLHAIHDITAPLFHYLKTEYSLKYTEVSSNSSKKINLSSQIKSKCFGKVVNPKNIEIQINESGISKLEIKSTKKNIEAQCEVS